MQSPRGGWVSKYIYRCVIYYVNHAILFTFYWCEWLALDQIWTGGYGFLLEGGNSEYRTNTAKIPALEDWGLLRPQQTGKPSYLHSRDFSLLLK